MVKILEYLAEKNNSLHRQNTKNKSQMVDVACQTGGGDSISYSPENKV